MQQRTYQGRWTTWWNLGLVILGGLMAGHAARAEMPPAAYRHMQQVAPEVSSIKVLSIKTRPAQNGLNVDMIARVVSVQRSKTKLRRGKLIHINYFHRTKMLAGPGPIPLLTVGHTYPAFLIPVKGEPFYTVAAGDCSFLRLD